MCIQQFLCPRIRLTKTDGSRAIIPIDAISGIEEDKRCKCVRINTMDGFAYDVVNGIIEVDKKIDEAIMRVNAAVPIVLQNDSPMGSESIPQKTETYKNAKAERFKKKRMLSAGIEKPARRVDALVQAENADASASSPAFVENQKSAEKDTHNATGVTQKTE